VPPEELVGKPLAGILGTQEDGVNWGEQPPSGVCTFELEQHWIECTFGILRREQGGRVMAVLRESTERLQDHMRSLERKNRQLDQFAYAASHDLKAPLRAIANLSAWIREDIGDDLSAESGQHLALLQDRVQRLERLISGLHAYASAGQGAQEVEDVEVCELIDEILSDADPAGIFARWVDCRVKTVHAHRTLVWQVLANLVNNAVRHHHDPLQGWIAVGCEALPDGFLLSVADNGPGIDPAQQDRIFDIFHTLRPKDETGGLGLGLALVKRIVDDIGGDIRLESEPGVGSRFTIHWPVG
jgi:signal transduction histidine kinase